MALDTDITIPELPTSTSESNNDLILLTQPNAQAETGYSSAKATTEVVAKKILGGIEFPTDLSGFPQNEQNPFDALNYLKQKIEEIYPVETVSGAIANFNTPLALPLVNLKANITAQQAGTGTPSPTNVRNISGFSSVETRRTGKNIWGGSQMVADFQDAVPASVVDTTNKTLTFNASDTANRVLTKGIPFKENTQYTFVITGIRTGGGDTNLYTNLRIYYTDGTYTTPAFSAKDVKETLTVVSTSGKTVNYLSKNTQSGSTTLYYDECGIFEGSISASEYEVYNADKIIVNLGDTYYGGVLDVTGGQSEKTYAKYKIRDLGTISRYTNFFIVNIGNLGFNSTDHYTCETFNNVGLKYDSAMQQQPNYSLGYSATSLKFRYDDSTDVNPFLEAVGDSIIVFELATSTPLSTTPTAITTIAGENNIFADSGDVEVSFRQGIQEYIDAKIAETQALIL